MNLHPRGLSGLQKTSVSIMTILMIVTFVMANLQAVLWQSSDWLVGAVLPAVVVDLTNKERAQTTAVPLVRNATLDAAAKLKAEDMARNEYFAHFSPAGVSPWHWFDEAGYVYAYAGENLAIHFTDSTEVVDAWMNSPAHRENIVNGVYTEIGVGTAKGKYEGYDTVYVVQLFGTPAVLPVVPVATAKPLVSVTEVAPLALVEPEVVIVPVVIEEPATPASAVLSEQTVRLDEEKVAVPDDSGKEILPVTPTESTLVADEGQKSIPIPEPETVLAAAPDVIMLGTPAIATSSGLAVASISSFSQTHAGGTMASLATQPHILLQTIYMILGSLVVLLLMASIVLEARRFHYVQVAYGVMLLAGMGGLWFLHALLTTGAVVV
jgi:hypothetical protein